jgi:glycosyltransferase involved in cell wall biosynthesis
MSASLHKELLTTVPDHGITGLAIPNQGRATPVSRTNPAPGATGVSVLFISHYCGRNGAPLILLRLLQWIKAHTNINIQVLLRSPGELQAEFEAIGTSFLVPRLSMIPSAIVRRTCGQSAVNAIEDTLLRRKVRRLNPSLIYSNTITNTRELLALAPLKVATLCHVHEMAWICGEFGPQAQLATVPLISRFVAVATAVRDHLVSGMGVNPEAIELVKEFPWSSPSPPREMAELRASARRELGVDEETFVVGACGTIDWRKGADLFLAVARAVSQGHQFRFIWIGGPTTGKFFEQLRHDIESSGLSNSVAFLGPSSTPEKYYAAMDTFLLTSREDPCPLVMLEAAAYGLPIVCFDGSGGAPEFVGNDAGIAVPYLDTLEMARALTRLRESPEMRERFAAVAKERVQERHDPDTQCAALFSAMCRTQPLLTGAART